MLGQSKTAHQAEIDSACELIDFWRFNAHSPSDLPGAAELRAGDLEPARAPGAGRVRLRDHPVQLHGDRGQPPHRPGDARQRGDLEAIRQGDAQRLLHHEAAGGGGAAAGRDQLRPGRPGSRSPKRSFSSRELAGIHYTGSTSVFQHIWRQVGERIDSYRSYPRLVGETGGKDFIVAHASADARRSRSASCAADSSTRGRSAALHRASTSRTRSGRQVRERTLEMLGGARRRRAGLPQLHGRGDRPPFVREDQRLHRARARQDDGVEILSRRR
jgi:1-pyrroline-5-carboxylate dehydrogenase